MHYQNIFSQFVRFKQDFGKLPNTRSPCYTVPPSAKPFVYNPWKKTGRASFFPQMVAEA